MNARRLAAATLATGVIAGLVGLACIHLLHWIQALAWDMHGGTLLEAASAVSPTRRVLVLTLGGVIGALSWFLLFRRNKAITSVSAAVDGTPMPPLRATWHALTQVLVVGLGASVGREVAPREMAAAFAAAAADRLGLRAEDRRIIGVPATAADTDVMALLRRKSKNHDRAPMMPPRVRTRMRRVGESALAASKRVSECMSQARAWIQWSRWMHVRPTRPAMTPVATVAIARRRAFTDMACRSRDARPLDEIVR